jgi:hypothetical protein
MEQKYHDDQMEESIDAPLRGLAQRIRSLEAYVRANSSTFYCRTYPTSRGLDVGPGGSTMRMLEALRRMSISVDLDKFKSSITLFFSALDVLSVESTILNTQQSTNNPLDVKALSYEITFRRLWPVRRFTILKLNWNAHNYLNSC